MGYAPVEFGDLAQVWQAIERFNYFIMNPVFAIFLGIVHLPISGNYQLLDAVRRVFKCDRTDTESYRPVIFLHQIE
jgi:hypothetical protein